MNRVLFQCVESSVVLSLTLTITTWRIPPPPSLSDKGNDSFESSHVLT